MKIFYLITKSFFGGVQTHIYQLSKYFTEKNNNVALMSYPGGWLEKKIKELDVKFYPNKFLSNSLNPFLGFRVKKEIEKAVFDFKPDLISCHSTSAGFWTRLAIKNKTPTIFTAHGWGFSPGTPFWRKMVLPFLEKFTSRYCQKIICVSDYDRDLALKYKIDSPEKLITIHNGVEIEQFSNSKFQNLNSKFKIVFIGRLTKQKDPMLLLEAFNEIEVNLKEKSEILIIGEGEKRKKLEKFVQKNNLKEKVKLLGALEREKVFEILKKSHIFVLTSNWEGFPRTILEAMSCGLAIVASDVGGVREAINESCGFLIKKGDKEGLKIALEKLLKNPPMIQKMAENCYKRVKENFSLEKMLKETEKVYFEVLNKI